MTESRSDPEMKPWRIQSLAATTMLFVATLAGCRDGRPTRVPVAGRVLIDGQPLEHGNIRFYPQNHRAASAKIGPGGRFTVSTYEFGDGCVYGNHPVSVNASQLLNPTTQRWHAPKKYYSPATSGLMVEVTEPTDEAEIHLSWDGGKPFDERILGGGE